MRKRAAVLLAAVLACQSNAGEGSTQMTDGQRVAIEGEIRAIVDTIYAAAREIRFDPIGALASSDDGSCLLQARIYPCLEVLNSYRKAWDPGKADRPRAQEMDGQEVKIHVLTPDVAIAAVTTSENRSIAADGKVRRAAFASLTVFRKEGGAWKSHSAQQASWPLDTAGTK